jgi:hypothetical protein
MSEWTVCRYGAADESPHPGEYPEHYNESAYVNFLDPVTKLGGVLRVANRPRDGYREFSVNLKLPGGAIAFRAGKEDSTANEEFTCGGLTLTPKDPTRTWHVRFAGSLTRVATPARMASKPGLVLKSSPRFDCEIELEWTARTPVFVLDRNGSGRATPGESSVMGTDHYEQFGSLHGTIRLGDTTWTLGGVPSMRDRSWGPRVWGSFTGEWMCAFLPDGTGMTLYSELQSDGVRACSGAVLHDGVPHYVEDFEVVTDYAGEATTDGRHRSVLHADGLPAIPLDGVVSHFTPVTMANGEHRTRLASMTVEFVGGAGGGALAEFLRPLPSGGTS